MLHRKTNLGKMEEIDDSTDRLASVRLGNVIYSAWLRSFVSTLISQYISLKSTRCLHLDFVNSSLFERSKKSICDEF